MKSLFWVVFASLTLHATVLTRSEDPCEVRLEHHNSRQQVVAGSLSQISDNTRRLDAKEPSVPGVVKKGNRSKTRSRSRFFFSDADF